MTFTRPRSSNDYRAKPPPTWRRYRAVVRENPLPRRRTRPDSNAPDGRSSQMLSFFIVAAPEIETPERAQCRDLSGRAKQLSPAMSPKKPQPPPKPSDLKYFFFVRP